MQHLEKLSGENHPRKIFRRDNWSTLNGEWDFYFDDDKNFETPAKLNWDKKIIVPFAPETPASGINDTDFHPRCWYRKKFFYQKTNSRTLLHFGAVDYQAHVWLNGHYLGSHEGGYTPFHFDVTEVLKDEKSEQILLVRADDDPADLAKPRGKQDWLRDPHSIWYPRTTGIWQTVWMEDLAATYIDKLKCTPFLERWEISTHCFLAGKKKEGLELKVTLKTEHQLLTKDSYLVINSEVHRQIALSDPGIDDFRNELLWSPEKPTLISIEIELWDGSTLLDKIYSHTALRSVSHNRDRLLLNGRPYYLRLVLDQGYWPDTHLTPPSEEDMKKDIMLVKSAGFNGVRKHQKIEDPNFYYWADVMGLLVWGEMPSAYRFTYRTVERVLREWGEVIERDFNHPCIVTWVPFNESWGVPDLAEKPTHQNFVQALYHLTKTLDPNRPCIGNDGWESTATDIIGIHDYDDQPSRLLKKYTTHENIHVTLDRYRPGGRVLTVEGFAHKGQPIMLTEFGGISFVNPTEDVAATWGYSAAQSAQDFRKRYEDLMNAIHRIEIFAGFCYTQFTDTFQETNGLFRMDRSAKFSINAMARATRGIGLGKGELISVPQPPPIPHDNDYHESGFNGL